MNTVLSPAAARGGIVSGTGAPALLFARRLVRALCLCAALIGTSALVVAPSADAASAFARFGGVSFAGPFGGEGTGPIRNNNRIAVDPATGNVLKTDPVGDQVVVYAPNGASLDQLATFGSGALTDPLGITIDPASGDVYVSDSTGIARYVPDGQPTPTYTLDNTFTVTGVAGALAFDAGNDQVLVADTLTNTVRRYSTAGVAGTSFDGSAGAGSPGAFTGLQDLAVKANGDVVVVDAFGGDPADSGVVSRVERHASNGDWQATIGPVDGAATVTVLLATDEVVVSGNQAAMDSWSFPSLSVFDADTTSRQVELNGIDGASTQWSTVSGLAAGAGSLYVATDLSRGSAPGAYGLATIQVYRPVVAPTAQTDPASSVSFDRATAHGTISPGGAATTYHVEYGPTIAYGSSTADATVPAGFDQVQVSAAITGLADQTDYHYRIVANNGVGGDVAGADQQFTTSAALPIVSAVTVAGVGTSSATVHARITVDGVAGAYDIGIDGVDNTHAQGVAGRSINIGAGAIDVEQSFSGLPAGRTFRVTVAARNESGTGASTDVTFATAPLPPYVPAPRPGEPSGPAYGCAAPRLNVLSAAVEPGQSVTVTGTDLGVAGSLGIGLLRVEPDAYSSSGFTFTVPDEVKGTLPLTLNCGQQSNTIALAIVPTNAFSSSVTIKSTTATVTAGLPGPGVIRAEGKYLKSTSKTTTTAGTQTLKLTLTSAGKAALKKAKSKKLKTTIRLRYTPTGGTVKSTSRTVTFKRGGRS